MSREGYKVSGTTEDGKHVGWIGEADSPRDAVNQAEGQFGHLDGISTQHPVRTLLPSTPDDYLTLFTATAPLVEPK